MTKDVNLLAAQSCPTLCYPMDCSSPGSSVHWNCIGKNNGVGIHSLLPGYLPHPRIKIGSPALHVDSLPSEAPRKP